VWIDVHRQEGRRAITIRDNGGGIPKEIMDKVGSLYFTTRKDGAGLGLHLVRMIIEKNGGTLLISNTSEGACFQIEL
ncbi:MAG: ATP-binding protein, partial [Spirochaetia bacterium]|nr:ATP-binding protein [Spirochaetia bacterium]